MKKETAQLSADELSLLDSFCRFLEKCGYLDSDWYSEKPTAIDRFTEQRKKDAK